METPNLNSRRSVRDVEAGAQLRDKLTHEDPRAVTPEPLRSDSMNSRLAGTLSSLYGRLFLIHVTGASCGDPAVKPSSADLSRLSEVQRHVGKMIGCGEGDLDAILVTVSYSISTCFPPTSNVLCRPVFLQSPPRLSPWKVTTCFHSTHAIRPFHYRPTYHLYLCNPSAYRTGRRPTGRTSPIMEMFYTSLLRPLSESTPWCSLVWCSALSSPFLRPGHNHRRDLFPKSPGTAEHHTKIRMRAYSVDPRHPGSSKPRYTSPFPSSSWALSTSSYPSTKRSPSLSWASFPLSHPRAWSPRYCRARGTTGHAATRTRC